MSLPMMQYRLDSLKTNIINGANKVGSEILYRKNLARVSMGIKGHDRRKLVETVLTKKEIYEDMLDLFKESAVTVEDCHRKDV